MQHESIVRAARELMESNGDGLTQRMSDATDRVGSYVAIVALSLSIAGLWIQEVGAAGMTRGDIGAIDVMKFGIHPSIALPFIVASSSVLVLRLALYLRRRRLARERLQ